MDHLIQVTNDGSHTIESLHFHASYHSRFGAIQESLTVFIDAGLQFVQSGRTDSNPIRILELGLGTGLNAWLSLCEAEKQTFSIAYTSVELFPLSMEIVRQLNYSSIHLPQWKEQFDAIHTCPWSEWTSISRQFALLKIREDVMTWRPTEIQADIIYYDAFGPTTQPELWSEAILSGFVDCLPEGGVFVTYCAKGDVRRTLQKLGLAVERLPGPPGKREILRGIKR